MTELEFKNTNPTSYGAGNINLLYSSSISTGSFLLPSNKYGPSGSFAYDNEQIDSNGNKVYYYADGFFPPYRILGLTIPFQSDNAVQLESTLSAVTKIKFNFGGTNVEVAIDQITKRSGYFHLRTFPVNVFTFIDGVDTSGTPYVQSVELIFEPYLAARFNNSDYNALINNATVIVKNSVAVQLDKQTDQMNPTNLAAVITQTATPASTQDSNYQITGWTNARYYGSKNTSNVPGDDTALAYKVFKGSIHPKDATVSTILSNISDSDTVDIYFNVARKPTDLLGHGELFITASSYPVPVASNFEGNFLYEEQGNRLIKIVDKKIHATDKGTVFTTNELGRITTEQS